MSGSPSNNGWFDDARRQFQKLIQSNFDTVELNEKLKPLLRKNKVKFNKQGKIRVLRIEGDFETNLLRDLIFPEYNDEDEMDDLYEKVKDISFKVLTKDKRKTKIED